MGLRQTPPSPETQAQSVPVDHGPQGAEGVAQPLGRFSVSDGADAEHAHCTATNAPMMNATAIAPRATASQSGQSPRWLVSR
jgi:hypothetical protein